MFKKRKENTNLERFIHLQTDEFIEKYVKKKYENSIFNSLEKENVYSNGISDEFKMYKSDNQCTIFYGGKLVWTNSSFHKKNGIKQNTFANVKRKLV